MADYEQSIADLIRGTLHDTQELIRSEIALARAEIRQEGRRVAVGVGLLAGAAVAGMLALVLAATAVAWGLAAAFAWPVWLGFAVVAGVALIATLIAAYAGRQRLTSGPHMPRTVAIARENAEWIRHRTS